VNGNGASSDSAVAAAPPAIWPLLVNAKEAARLLGIGRTTLYELINAGAITPVHIGRCVRFPVAELDRFVADGCTVDAHATQSTTPERATARRRRSSRGATSHDVALRLFDPAR
jgi:excisionase family DNA binding protein